MDAEDRIWPSDGAVKTARDAIDQVLFDALIPAEQSIRLMDTLCGAVAACIRRPTVRAVKDFVSSGCVLPEQDIFVEWGKFRNRATDWDPLYGPPVDFAREVEKMTITTLVKGAAGRGLISAEALETHYHDASGIPYAHSPEERERHIAGLRYIWNIGSTGRLSVLAEAERLRRQAAGVLQL